MRDEELAALVAAGKAAWPDIPLDDVTFGEFLSERALDGALPPLAHAGDLFLACACSADAKGAAAAFERHYRAVVEHAVARVDRGAVDEGTQVVFVSLLVASAEAGPRIVTYSGRSSLRAWLTTVATRATLKLHRRIEDKGHESLEGLALAFTAAEPELVLARARHGPDLAAAIRTALTLLERRELVLLRLHHTEGWSVDRLALLYRVGRSTAARWVAAAREHLVEAAKGDLRTRLNLTPSELESLVVLLQSNFELSLLRLLGDSGSPADDPSK